MNELHLKNGSVIQYETQPTAKELADGLGKLASCFSIPAAAYKHHVNVVKPEAEVELIYLDALDLLRRFYHPDEVKQ